MSPDARVCSLSISMRKYGAKSNRIKILGECHTRKWSHPGHFLRVPNLPIIRVHTCCIKVAGIVPKLKSNSSFIFKSYVLTLYILVWCKYRDPSYIMFALPWFSTSVFIAQVHKMGVWISKNLVSHFGTRVAISREVVWRLR